MFSTGFSPDWRLGINDVFYRLVRLGLVDAVGSEGDCIIDLADAVGLEDPRIVEEQPVPTLIQLLLGESASSIKHHLTPGARLSYRVDLP